MINAPTAPKLDVLPVMKILPVLIMLLGGCSLPPSRVPLNLPDGIYETRIESFVIRGDGGWLALALPDGEFHDSRYYNGAPSLAALKAAPLDYPHVMTGLPAGTRLRFRDAKVTRGYELGFGFGARTDVLVDILDSPWREVEINDFIVKNSRTVEVNPNYLAPVSEAMAMAPWENTDHNADRQNHPVTQANR